MPPASSTAHIDRLSALPTELHLLIGEHLDAQSLANLRVMSRQFAAALYELFFQKATFHIIVDDQHLADFQDLVARHNKQFRRVKLAHQYLLDTYTEYFQVTMSYAEREWENGMVFYDIFNIREAERSASIKGLCREIPPRLFWSATHMFGTMYKFSSIETGLISGRGLSLFPRLSVLKLVAIRLPMPQPRTTISQTLLLSVWDINLPYFVMSCCEFKAIVIETFETLILSQARSILHQAIDGCNQLSNKGRGVNRNAIPFTLNWKPAV